MSAKHPAKPQNLLKFHSADSNSTSTSRKSRRNELLIGSSSPVLQFVLKPESRRCLHRLASYQPPKPTIAVPRSKRAAVLVALFIGRHGDLYVLLSRRSATLRTYAGDTSLPGGKVEKRDRNIEDTARREAFEEIGLPRDRRKVPLLCILEPFLAAELVVTPVVVLILDNTLRPILNKTEVASLFSHPLAFFLSTTSPFDASEPETVEVDYHKSFTVEWSAPHRKKYPFMVHQFLTGREAGGIKPIFGLTAGILIRAAIVGYGREPEFEVTVPGVPSLDERIAWALLSKPVFRRACEKEGIDLTLPMKLCGVTREEFNAMRKEQDEETAMGGQAGKGGLGRSRMSRRGWLRVWRAKL